MNLSREYIGEGNGTPLQYSCLENPMDGGAWKAAVHGPNKFQFRRFYSAVVIFTDEVERVDLLLVAVQNTLWINHLSYIYSPTF